MYLFLSSRHRMMISILDQIKLNNICELGVHRGEFSDFMLRHLDFQKMFLIDSWSAEQVMKTYCNFESTPYYIEPYESFSEFFGGPTTQQSTFDATHNYTLERFKGNEKIEIIKSDSFTILEKFDDKSLDLIYIDANHQYEYVLRDLMYWSKKVSDDGFIFLNDCLISDLGRKQNLGVLQAVLTFMKYSDFVPVAMNGRDWADVVLMKRTSRNLQKVTENIKKYPNLVEVPDHLFPLFTMKQGKDGNYPSFSL